MNIIQLLGIVALCYGVLRFWKWKLKEGYDLEEGNIAYLFFLSTQLLSVFLIYLNCLDPQVTIYFDSMSMFGSGAFDFWTSMGIIIFGSVFVYMIANVLGHMVFRVGTMSEIGLYEEIKTNNITASLIASVLILILSYISSYTLLRSFIFDWISEQAGLVPII